MDWGPGSRPEVEDRETESRSPLGPGMAEAGQRERGRVRIVPWGPKVQRGLEEGQKS